MPQLLKLLNYLIFKCLLPYQAQLGVDLQLSHWALGVVMHPNVTIGDPVRIYHNVKVAAETAIGSPHRIFIGNDVTIGVGAIIVGRGDTSLVIGDGAFVGAGAVVFSDVAEGQTVVGIPAISL